MDMPVKVVSNSSALVPARELPLTVRPGDHTQTLNSPGITARIPPPTPLLPGVVHVR
jgi:hypothetical protein